MEYTFSNKVANLKASAIREILKMSSAPGYYPLSAGNPAPDAFPVQAVKEITADIMQNRPIDALQYSITEGYVPLREHLTKYMKEHHNVGRDFDSILITSGAQQAMNLLTMALCNEGDTVICEDPSFIGSLNAFRSFGLNLVGIPMEQDGMNIEKLEKALKENKNVRFIYCIPTFQNPSGICTSLQKRHAIYELAKKHNVLVLEDNPYSDTRFAGEELPTIKSFDEDGIVIYAGSFSKVISPGVRVGYAIAPAPIIGKMTVCKQTNDVHTNIFGQILCHEFMTKYDYQAHLNKNRLIYKQKAELTMDMLDKCLAPNITYSKVDGGLFIWCELPKQSDMIAFCEAAIAKKVAVVPGVAFNACESAISHNFRINYSTPTDQQIIDGIEILGSVAKEFFK